MSHEAGTSRRHCTQGVQSLTFTQQCSAKRFSVIVSWRKELLARHRGAKRANVRLARDGDFVPKPVWRPHGLGGEKSGGGWGTCARGVVSALGGLVVLEASCNCG